MVCGGSVVKNLPANEADKRSFHQSERSPREGNGNPLQYSCLGQRSLAGYGAWDCERVGYDLTTKQQQNPAHTLLTITVC